MLVGCLPAGVPTYGEAIAVTPDLIPQEAGEWIAASSDAAGQDRVFLVAPSSTEERLRLTTAVRRGGDVGMGVTGARAQSAQAAPVLVSCTRAVTTLPIGVGLGVSNGDQAAEVGSYAGAVIVRPAFVRRVLGGADQTTGKAGVEDLARDLAAEVRGRGQ